ncbi:MAG: alpha-galactosidase [Lachnospiraceae bacterium]|nr:alpha-galactosidase [Lachnospiraceae bacterium]
MMIQEEKGFRLETAHTSYWFRVTPFGHLEHVWYGPKLTVSKETLPCQDASKGTATTHQGLWEALALKRTIAPGSSVIYDEKDSTYCLNVLPQEWSTQGRGDYRETPCELVMPNGTMIHDFQYRGRKIVKGACGPETLPGAYASSDELWKSGEGECLTECAQQGGSDGVQTLIVYLQDALQKVYLTLYYTVYEDSDVITRRVVLRNEESQPLQIHKLLSCMIDIPDRHYRMLTFDGTWIREAHRHETWLEAGSHVNQSATGASSNQHNPGFLLAEEGADEDRGCVYGYNLIYSGNHYSCAEVSVNGTVRVMSGIQPRGFQWTLQQGERFETPEAVLTFSDRGLNGASAHFHDFVNEHVVRGDWKKKERPVLFNNWEATFFDFNESRLMTLAKKARDLGAELFVLDDGWFGARNNDVAGLGDYNINRKKLPSGLKGFGEKVKAMGMKFGLWFEPEMVNEDSDLYRAHPEYAVIAPGRKPVKGRNQLVLDLCNPAVQDYIIKNVGRVLDENGIDYVKWDMNRHIAENYSPWLAEQGISQGQFYHRYIMGLYRVLGQIFHTRPHILFESCSSGGNRFDLGMLCYSQQVWSSDDTDPIERLKIQGGLSYLYPQSTMGAHVSMAPHQQTLRDTPLSTRFNVSAFGCLGYELDLRYLTPKEQEEIRNQIAFYKEHRALLQYGRFRRVPYYKKNKVLWQCTDENGDQAISGFFQTLTEAAESSDRLTVKGLQPEAMYQVQTKEQYLYIRRFGNLIKHVAPVDLDPNGFVLRTVNKRFTMNDSVENYVVPGQALESGIWINNQFIGTGYNTDLRLLGDFGSQLYVIDWLSDAGAQLGPVPGSEPEGAVVE